MGDLDGVGRVYRTEFNPPVERHPQVDRSERDKQGKDHEERKDEEPHDTVELHDGQQEDGDDDKPKRPADPRRLDISA